MITLQIEISWQKIFHGKTITQYKSIKGKFFFSKGLLSSSTDPVIELLRSGASSIRPKFPKIPVQNRIRNGTESFRKFVSKILVILTGLSFFLEIWKFRKLPFCISTWYDLGPSSSSREFCLDQSYKMAASRHYAGCEMICHSSNLFLIAYPPQKHQGGQFAQFPYSLARKARKFLSSHENDV